MRRAVLFILSMLQDLLIKDMDEFDRTHLERAMEMLEQILE